MNRALGSMFGGLAEFIKNNRALKQNTEDREYLGKRRDLDLRGGEQGLDLTAEQIEAAKFRNTRAPIEASQGDLKFTADLAGPQALREALTTNPDQMFGSGITAKSMLPGVQAQVGRQETSDKILGSQATLQENAATASGIRTGALQEVASNPSLDPTNSREALNKFSIAGVAAGPTYGQEFKDRQTLQNDAQSHAAGMQQTALRFQETMANRALPPGVDPQVDSMATESIKQFAGRAQQFYREMDMLDREIVESSRQARQLQLLNKPMETAGQQGQLQDAIRNATARKAQLQKELQAAGQQIQSMIGQFVASPQALQHYKGLMDIWMVGATPGPGTTTAPVKTGPVVE